jgi:hypothetical protein
LILLYPPNSQDKIKAEVLAKLKNCFLKYCWFRIVWDIKSIADNNETKAFDDYHGSQTSACEIEPSQEGLVHDYRFNPTIETCQNLMETI